MFGEFRDGHPRLVLRLRGDSGTLELEFVVDTGFEGSLAIPLRCARQLALQPAGTRIRQLANGSTIRCPYYRVCVEWDEGERIVEALLLEGQPLIGTKLIADHLLRVEAAEGGEILIEPL
jgi:clan AA aspartic protease